VFITAGSWLDVGYGLALREFLLRNFRVTAIIESAVEGFFTDASINTVVTVLEREQNSSKLNRNKVRFVRLTAPLERAVNLCGRNVRGFARSLESIQTTVTADTYRVRLVNQAELLYETVGAARNDIKSEGKGSGWGKYLRADDVFFRILDSGKESLTSLSKVARVRFGIKTGANEFFYVVGKDGRDGTKLRKQLQTPPDTNRGATNPSVKRLSQVATIRRGVTTGANDFFYLRAISEEENRSLQNRPSKNHRDSNHSVNGKVQVRDGNGVTHMIESHYLSPVLFSLKDIKSVVIEKAGGNRFLFNCSREFRDLAGTDAAEYIRHGERTGYHLRPTCASRQKWYAVVNEMEPAPLIFPSKVGERWVVPLNQARFFEDKKLYGIFPNAGTDPVVLAAVLNSTWARYYAEITCRQMTGSQAIADIDVVVAEGIVLPDPRRLSGQIKKQLITALSALAKRPVMSLFEEVKRSDRRKLDHLVLLAMGFTDRDLRNSTLRQLYDAVVGLVRERLEKRLVWNIVPK
jgi:hypothetical protein